MPSPFPGMDPYLERTAKWLNVHQWLIFGVAEALGQVLPERYYVSIEERVSVSGQADLRSARRPDTTVIDTGGPWTPGGVAVLERGVEVAVPEPETVRESYLEIVDLQAGEEVVTVLEVLSPTNKLPGPRRDQYLEKRNAVLAGTVNLVEVDLLRAAPRMPVRGAPEQYDYGILLSRAVERPRAVLLPFSVRESIPRIPLPLRPGEEEPWLDFGAVLSSVYDRGRFARFVRYGQPPQPILRDEDAVWAEALLREKGLR